MRLPRAILSLFFLPLLAFAQAARDATQTLEKMVVTAPRVAAADLDGPDDLRTYDESEIESTGAFNVQEGEGFARSARSASGSCR